MANVNALERGLGSISAVSAHHQEAMSQLGLVEERFDLLGNILEYALNDPQTERSAKAIVCAFLNANFSKSGVLYSVSDKGSVSSEWINNENVRKCFAELISD